VAEAGTGCGAVVTTCDGILVSVGVWFWGWAGAWCWCADVGSMALTQPCRWQVSGNTLRGRALGMGHVSSRCQAFWLAQRVALPWVDIRCICLGLRSCPCRAVVGGWVSPDSCTAGLWGCSRLVVRQVVVQVEHSREVAVAQVLPVCIMMPTDLCPLCPGDETSEFYMQLTAQPKCFLHLLPNLVACTNQGYQETGSSTCHVL